MKWLGAAKTIEKPEVKETHTLTSSDVEKTKSYLVRQLKDYVEWDEDDPDHIEQVCRIVDALSKLKGLV